MDLETIIVEQCKTIQRQRENIAALLEETRLLHEQLDERYTDTEVEGIKSRLSFLIENLANKLVAVEDENKILQKELESQNSLIRETLNKREKENQDWKEQILKEKLKPFTGNVND